MVARCSSSECACETVVFYTRYALIYFFSKKHFLRLLWKKLIVFPLVFQNKEAKPPNFSLQFVELNRIVISRFENNNVISQ